ncbi:MAG: hypothetical protein QGI60_02700 [archaeon]|jgi:hypothetical protein|nr:hypothetical protein [archaeon]
MSRVANLGSGLINQIPLLFAKIGTVLLFILTIGMAARYFFALSGYSYIILLVPIASMAVMWKKLDEGTLLFVVLLALLFLFPEFFLG